MTHRPAPDGSTVPLPRETIRCGRAMNKYEKIWGALLDDVLCGRPAGHKGQCRSGQAMERTRQRQRDRWPQTRERRNARRAFTRLPVADQLAIAVADAAEEARWQALGR